jgi:tetratricopeptide (TPR) repeat protein
MVGSGQMADTTLRDEVQAAEAEIAAGHPEQALARCQKLQDSYPRALIIQRVLGEIYLAQRKPREALAALERVLTGDPEDARACCTRALIHQLHGDANAALAWYRRACDIRPEDATLRSAYRELAASLGRPSYRPTSLGLARVYLRAALYTHAAREWESMLAQQPDRMDAQVGLAETYWRAGDTLRATEVAGHIASNTRTCVKALLIVAALEHAKGNDDECARLLQRALELDPERRIGRALYADQFARGDIGLEAMFLGAPDEAAVPAVSRAHVTDQLAVEAEALADVPTVHTTAAPAVPPRTGPTAAVAAVNGPAPIDRMETAPYVPAASGSVPANFHDIFKETEFMLWGRDQDDTQITSADLPSAGVNVPDPFEGSRVIERPEHSAGAVPPALVEAKSTLDDTETRAAIGWVRWLQAQGARPIDVAARSELTPPRVGSARDEQPPTRESLREMFAELAPPTGGTGVVEGELIGPAGQDEHADVAAVVEASRGAPFGDGAAPVARVSSAEPPASAPDAADTADAVSGAAPAPDAAEQRTAQPSAAVPVAQPAASATGQPRKAAAGDSEEEGVVTLEDLEEGFATSGFQPFEPLPGRLAALAQAQASGRPEESPATGAPAAPKPVDEPEPAVEPSPPPDLSVDPLTAEPAGFQPTPSLDASAAEPGASVAAQESSAPDAELRAPEAPELAAVLPPPIAPPPVPAPAREEATPDADDYLGRLRVARRNRADGRVEEALVEYRALLRDSPEVLDDIIHDLRDMCASTENADVHRLLGDAYIREGNYLSALESYNRALAMTQGTSG